MQTSGTIDGEARAFLIHMFGRGFEDGRYVVERFQEAPWMQYQTSCLTNSVPGLSLGLRAGVYPRRGGDFRREPGKEWDDHDTTCENR